MNRAVNMKPIQYKCQIPIQLPNFDHIDLILSNLFDFDFASVTKKFLE